MDKLRQRAKLIVEKFVEHDLLTSCSAISFQVLTGLVPFALFTLGLLGILGLGDVWRDHVAPHVRHNISAPAFEVVNGSANRVLGPRRLFWVSAGGVLTWWEISGAVRAVMGAFNRIYGADHERPWRARMRVSSLLAIAVGLCFMLAIAAVELVPLLTGKVGSGAIVDVIAFVVRWGIAAALLTLAVGLLVRYGTVNRQPLGWVSFGSLIVIAAWIVMSLAFGFYLAHVADYASLFGNLATVFVLLGYIYASTVVFLGGIQLDALVREDARGDASGVLPRVRDRRRSSDDRTVRERASR